MPTSIATGTYNSDNVNYQAEVTLFIQNGSNISSYVIQDASGMAPSKYTINITSVTTDALTGTFTAIISPIILEAVRPISEVTEGNSM